MQLENETVFNEAVIEEREQGISEIHQQIGEVNEIFKDLAVLVHEQGYMIGSSEHPHPHTHTHTHRHDDVLFQIVFWQFEHLCCQQSRCISLVVTSSPSWQRDEEQQKTKAKKK
jgi:hypothetical protein